MSDEKATREKLMEYARQEFLEKGYMKASLRSICKKAGVTTGALYFFFQNKEDLLSAIVDDTIKGIMEMITRPFFQGDWDRCPDGAWRRCVGGYPQRQGDSALSVSALRYSTPFIDQKPGECL